MKETKNKAKKVDLLQLFCLFGIIFTGLFIINNVGNMWRGIHNIDNSYNFQGISEQLCKNYNLSVNLTDTANDFQTRPIKDYYIIGMNQITDAYKNTLISLILFGILVGILIGKNLL